jgi:hypothetical protein
LPKFEDIRVHDISDDLQAWAKSNGFGKLSGRTWAGWWKMLNVRQGKNKFHLESGEVIKPDRDFVKALQEVDRPVEIELPKLTVEAEGSPDGNEGNDGKVV